MSLTAIEIRNAKSSKKARTMFGRGGLYLEVTPRGGKWWQLKYRFADMEKRLSLGVFPDVPLKQARRPRAPACQLVAWEIDSSERCRSQKTARAERSANSFEAVTREWVIQHSPNWAFRSLWRCGRHASPAHIIHHLLELRQFLRDLRAVDPVSFSTPLRPNVSLQHHPWCDLDALALVAQQTPSPRPVVPSFVTSPAGVFPWSLLLTHFRTIYCESIQSVVRGVVRGVK